MATHSSTLAWKIPWTEEPGRLQSMGSQRVGHDWVTSRSLFTFHALEKEMATHSSVLAWRIPGMAEPGGLPSMGSHRVGHEWSDLAAAAAWWKHLHEWAKVSNLQLFCFVFPYHIFRKYSSFSFYTFSIIYFLYSLLKSHVYSIICCCHLHPTLCDPVHGSTLCFPVLHHLPELVQTHVHWEDDAIQPSHPLLSPSPPVSIFPSIKVFLMSRLLASVNQSIGASVSASVLPMNI